MKFLRRYRLVHCPDGSGSVAGSIRQEGLLNGEEGVLATNLQGKIRWRANPPKILSGEWVILRVKGPYLSR